MVCSVHFIPPRVGASMAVVSSFVGSTCSTRRVIAGIDRESFPRSTREISSHWNRVGSNEASDADRTDGMYFFNDNEGTTTDTTHSVGRSRAKVARRDVNDLEAGLP